MDLENLTPFNPATFVSAKEGAGWVTTILVKAAFEIRHGKVVKPLDEQLFPVGDSHPAGADLMASSLAYASDFVPYKLRADVLLSATAYRPADQPAGTFRVGVRVGNLVKQLAVSGRREFTGILASTIVEREPLAKIPVTYENAFGGPNYAQNPLGKGRKSYDLPSIEYFDQRLRMAGDKIAPAGFGPIATDWEPRKSMFGTIGPDYMEKHWPGYPANFDARYFNAAPEDQQIAGHLRGDEEVVLENLHPAHPNFATRLPGWRVVCTRENEDGNCSLIPLVIDTLWINPDANQLVLVWRGRTSVHTPDALEIKRLGFLIEALGSKLADAASYQKQLQELIDQRDAEFEPEATPDEAPTEVAVQQANASAADAGADTDVDGLQAVQAELTAFRAEAGHAPELEFPASSSEPRPLSPEAQAKYDELLANFNAEERRQAEDDATRKWSREKVIAAVAQKQPLVDADMSGLDLHDCNLADADFQGAKLNGVNFTGSLLTRARLTGCSMVRATLDSASLDEADLAGANLQGATLGKATLVSAKLAAVDFTNAVLDGANLSAASAQRTVFHGASLRATIFSKADLTSAILSRAQGPQSNFEAATLAGAACDHADFSRANFKKADLSDSDFTASKLNDADLSGVVAVDANFTEAELQKASFRGANCDGMWLSSAHADGADFQKASCIDMQFDGTSAKQANFSYCRISTFRGQAANLGGATFRHAVGTEPIFESCRVDGADFSCADVPGASFIHASAIQANFTGAELKSARFDHANCQLAVFATANLFQAVFAGVNLIGADISEANFYGVEFLDARISKLRFSNCNLQMTKLEQWAATKNR